MILRNLNRHFTRLTNQKPAQLQRRYHQLIDIHPEIRHSLSHKQPVVALESTIITHGMPYPQNLKTACEVEQQVRQNGALPATIAILNGRIKVGLQSEELQQLAQTKREDVTKCSRRDLPYLVANKASGGTTVAATMLIAHKVGISVFATGGVGGVHRDGHITMDVSADLVELGRTPVAVVCSGVKSILDIPRTLEYLETQGVCVATYGVAKGRFPDFYTRDSGCRVAYNCDTPEQAAKLIRAMRQLQLGSGMLIGVPVPEAFAADKRVIANAIDEAYSQALEQGVSGKDVTPFLLAAIAKITKGSSLEANMALIKNNAAVAARIAKALSEHDHKVFQSKTTAATPTVVGGSILDLSMTLLNDEPLELKGATYEVSAKQSAGGVGHNLAEGIFKLHGNANFISAIGADEIGKNLLQLLPSSLKRHIHIHDHMATSMCTVMFDKAGDCKLVLGNMEIHKAITPELIRQHEEMLSRSPLIVFDGNLSLESMQCLLEIAAKHRKPVFFEPTDMLIAGKPFTLPAKLRQQIKMISPNLYEFKAIAETVSGEPLAWSRDMSLSAMSTEELLHKCQQVMPKLSKHFDCVLLTLGHHGVLLSLRSELLDGFFDSTTGQYKDQLSSLATDFKLHFYAAPKVENICNVSGAGDSFTSGFISEMLRGSEIRQCIAMGFIAAERALQSTAAVPNRYFNNHQEREMALRAMLSRLQEEKL